jgi:hypothetical protein
LASASFKTLAIIFGWSRLLRLVRVICHGSLSGGLTIPRSFHVGVIEPSGWAQASWVLFSVDAASAMEKHMSRLKAFIVAATLIAISFTPALAQGAVMSEPGYCAQFYPNANCQNKGPGNPYTDPNYRRNRGQSSGQWPPGEPVVVAPTWPSRTRLTPTTYR